MARTNKIILAIATLWPIIYSIAFIVFVLSRFILASSYSYPQSELEAAIYLISVLHPLTIIIIVVLLVVYIRNLFKNNHVSRDKKALWAVVLFLGNIFAMPIYWYLYIWNQPNEEPCTALK
jgi:hypothetical protein